MKNPTVSIIIPVYNAEGTITRCLDSIIHQTYSSIEVIIIDDGSSDLSGSICDNYATKYNYIQVTEEVNIPKDYIQFMLMQMITLINVK